ncbi:unannotated protein [freshwater metagenome]|uniref:Unannotated protein n=1 Tax=freshwater metagenome TaxID=449393 RepID=A0A6J7IJJ2_9ZZZZ
MQCWGANYAGQLGNNSTTESHVPVTVTGITTATAITADGDVTCAVLAGGGAQCWGANWDGQLGNNSTTQSNVPVTVTGLTTATAITTDGDQTCALLTGGAVQCWGWGGAGSLGNGIRIFSTVPLTVGSPDTPAPVARVTAPTATLQASAVFTVSWTATDPVVTDDRTSGVEYTYVIVRSQPASGGTFTTYSPWKSNSTARTGRFTGSPGTRYCFSTQARDNNLNTSAWSAEKCTTIPVDERALTRSSSTAWTRTTSSGWIASTASTTTRKGASLTTASSATVRQIGIVAWRCRTCGTVDLYIGTSKVGTLNLYKAGTATRSLLTLTRFKANKTGKVSVRVTTSGKLVKIDALALSRT